MMTSPWPLDVALVHDPVINRRGEVIGSAVTNLDLHDIARACRTFGLRRYWVVTPHEEQRQLVREIIGHWTHGHGRQANPDRGTALALIRVVASVDEMMEQAARELGRLPRMIGTSARGQENEWGYDALAGELKQRQPVILVFGTAWGLAPELFDRMDGVLPPIQGVDGYNHLSVRSAVSIILDRLARRMNSGSGE